MHSATMYSPSFHDFGIQGDKLQLYHNLYILQMYSYLEPPPPHLSKKYFVPSAGALKT